ncbi:MAG: hypothetical protein H0T46_22015 [Deltaproteobacteria bacterium]|nr:hypothetical protein [Deltaproteobacteria bacterium]
MDLVFVVDDSGSMSEEQGNLATNFPMFASVLENYVNADGEHIDFRIAVTTTGKPVTYTISFGGQTLPPMTENGPDGAFAKNCGVAQNYLDVSTPNLGTTLGCRANVGTGGSSYEMPLLMAKHALGERVADGKNAGFLRDDALLGVVMLTDEDDSSSSQSMFTIDGSNPNSGPMVDFDPDDLIQFFDTLKGHRSRWAAGVIAGETACMSSFGKAAEATRLKQFVQMTNQNGSQQAVFSSICAGNLTMALSDVLAKFQAACGGIIL